ncbi:MAG TPA: TetR/AcrR family transcriptional regulator, partial [Solimonas sp.]
MKKSAPSKTRTRNPEQTRAKLLQATIDLLADKGADALSLKEAARIAKVSRGVAYQHFQDRDHLLREAKAWLSDRLIDSLGGERSPESTL